MHVYVCVCVFVLLKLLLYFPPRFCCCCCSWRCISLFFIQLHKARTQFVARLLLIFCYTISVKLHKPCQNDLWTLERIEQTNFMHKCINRRNQMVRSQINNNFNRRHWNKHTNATHKSHNEKHSTNIKLKQYREYNAIFKRIQHTLKSMLEHELKNLHNFFFYSGDFWISYLPSIFFHSLVFVVNSNRLLLRCCFCI